jgi:putative MATE family efflux protein
MVGQLGARASAAIGLVESSTWLFGSITSAASMGFSVQVAHFIGAKDFIKARQVFRHALIATTILSLIMAVVAAAIAFPLPYWLGGGADIAHDASMYFLIFALAGPFFMLSNLSGSMQKCAGDMRIPSIVSVLMCVLDVCFNYVFIFIAGLGVVGAALGTFFAIVAGAGVNAYFAIFRNSILSLRLDRARFHWVSDYIRHAFQIGAPMAVQSLLMSGAQIVSTIIVAPLGNFAIAANTFAITAESLCYMPGYGIGDAATTLVGQSKGAGRYDICKNFAFTSVFLGMAVMAFMGIVMYVFAPRCSSSVCSAAVG